MAIEIAPDNHLATLHRLTKNDLEMAVFETVDQFKESCEDGSFTSDESGYWACEYEGSKYCGPNVKTHKRPKWATHVYWYGK